VHESTTHLSLPKTEQFLPQKLSNIARQQNAQQRAEFQTDCELYSPEMLVFIDETGCNRRDSMRKFGYALKGKYYA